MDKKNENTGSAINEKLKAVNDSFKSNIDAVNDVYETAKDLMIRLNVPMGEFDAQVDLFKSIQTLRNMAVTAMKMHKSHMEELITMDLSDGKEVKNGD